MTTVEDRSILVASFATSRGGARGAAALAENLLGRIGNVSLLTVDASGRARFAEPDRWGTSISRVDEVLTVLAHPEEPKGWPDVAIGTHGDDAGGQPDDRLVALGGTLRPNSSVLVLEIDASAFPRARQLLVPLSPVDVLVA